MTYNNYSDIDYQDQPEFSYWYILVHLWYLNCMCLWCGCFRHFAFFPCVGLHCLSWHFHNLPSYLVRMFWKNLFPCSMLCSNDLLIICMLVFHAPSRLTGRTAPSAPLLLITVIDSNIGTRPGLKWSIKACLFFHQLLFLNFTLSDVI